MRRSTSVAERDGSKTTNVPESFIETNGFLAHPDFLPLLARLGFNSFDAVLQFEGGDPVAERRRTTVVRLEVEGRNFYLKRHLSHPIRDFLRAVRRCQRVDKNGKREWANILFLSSLGINTVTPVACGRRKRPNAKDVVDSFILTLGLDHAVPLDDFYNRCLGPPRSREQVRLKRAIIKEMARILGGLHRRGVYHQDMHFRHFYIAPLSENDFRLYLIDLQPLLRSWRFKYKTKDLARLYLDTLTHVPVSRADRLRFYQCYCERRRINLFDKLFFGLISTKAWWMGRRLPPQVTTTGQLW